jgi:hypothetical protein
MRSVTRGARGQHGRNNLCSELGVGGFDNQRLSFPVFVAQSLRAGVVTEPELPGALDLHIRGGLSRECRLFGQNCESRPGRLRMAIASLYRHRTPAAAAFHTRDRVHQACSMLWQLTDGTPPSMRVIL